MRQRDFPDGSMRDFNKVFVVALPRCATVSMCEALGTFGIRIAHLGKICGEHVPEHHDSQKLIRIHDQIVAADFDLDILKDCDGLADYPACIPETIEALDRQYPGSLFINVRRDRDPQAWLRSAERQFIGLEMIKAGQGATPDEREFMQAMTDFRRMTFGNSTFDAPLYRAAYDRHWQQVARYFAGREDVFLDIEDISVLAGHGFELLARFLRCHAPSKAFPRSDGHSQAPQRAFMEALARGEIASQTGNVPA